jgi:ribosomal protein S18 acetylase RimI-like enzyme
VRIIPTTDHELVARLNKPVHELHHRLYPTYFKAYSYESIKEVYKEIIHNPDFVFLVIEDGNQYFGYAWIETRTYPENPFRNSYQSVYVHQISIEDSVRNKGYGTKLLEAIYEFGRDNQIALVELDYWSNNHIAKGFYKKHGFKMYREFVYKEL